MVTGNLVMVILVIILPVGHMIGIVLTIMRQKNFKHTREQNVHLFQLQVNLLMFMEVDIPNTVSLALEIKKEKV